MPSVDLYQIHWNSIPPRIETWMNGLADALDRKLIGGAGVSNYNRAATIRAHDALQKRGYGLTSNQVEYHLLNRSIEHDGTFEACRERGIKVIAYSPLAMGLLTGKYSSENPPPGMRRVRYLNTLQKIDPLIALLKEIGERHGKTPAQVALNWVICKGAIPIPGAKNASQVQQNAGAVGWRLSADEMDMLDGESRKV
jgi:aryl-alcohol dehydrogenase-like predicted oxidoreductase